MTYLHKIDPANHPAANCPLCNDPNHDSLHLFNCPDIPTTLTVWDLWTDPVGVAALLDVWGEKLGGPRAGVWDPVRAHAQDGVDTTTTTTNRSLLVASRVRPFQEDRPIPAPPYPELRTWMVQSVNSPHTLEMLRYLPTYNQPPGFVPHAYQAPTPSLPPSSPT